MFEANIEQVKERIRPRLLSSEYQPAELEELVKKNIAGDIWLTWYIDLTDIARQSDAIHEGSAIAPVSYEMANMLDLSIEDLLKLGYENTRGKSTINTMHGVLSAICRDGMYSEAVDETVYVISNQESLYGAAAILDPDIQAQIREKFGSKFLLAPSSIHEWLVLQADGTTEQADELAHIVHTINHDPAVMCPKDILSDHVYCIQDNSLAVVV